MQQLIETLTRWRDTDEPLVEAIGDTLAASARLDSQEQARRVVDTMIDVLRSQAADEPDQAAEIYPVTIVQARYGGIYEPGPWLAFPNDPGQLPQDWDGGDVLCARFWGDPRRRAETGAGDCPQAAYADLVAKLGGRRVS